MTIHSSHTYTVTDQAARWNANSAARLHELGSNDDPSYRALSHLILQKLTGLLPDGHGSVLDVSLKISEGSSLQVKRNNDREVASPPIPNTTYTQL